MSNNYKERVQRAIESFEARQIAKAKGPTRKNTKPEKTVEQACLIWMRSQKWDVNIFEAKATYDPRRGIYRQQAMKDGVVDCGGNMPSGHACWVEFKAPGKLSTLRPNQREFLTRKIETGCFGVVVDSAELLVKIYLRWRDYISRGDTDGAKRYLLDILPKKTKKPQEGNLWD